MGSRQAGKRSDKYLADFTLFTTNTTRKYSNYLSSVREWAHGIEDRDAVLLDFDILRSLTQNIHHNRVFRVSPEIGVGTG